MTVTIIITLAGVVSKVTDGGGVLTIEATVVTSWATAINGITVIFSAVEAVVIVSITDLIISLTLNIPNTHGERLTFSRLSVTEVLSMTISIIITLAGVVTQVTDRGGVLTVEATVVTSWATAILGIAVILATVEAV